MHDFAGAARQYAGAGRTRVPGETSTRHSGPKMTSTREPNLIMPTRSPACTKSPTFF